MTIDWQAIGAVVTALAVVVALLPVFMASSARKAKARNLRMRTAVKLTKLRPSIGVVAKPSSLASTPEFVLLSGDDLVRTVSELEALLRESEVLNPEEQDRLSQVVANLELMLPAMRAEKLSAEAAQSMLLLIDRAVAVLEEYGVLSSEPHQPWEPS
jgi:hypothetical protein